MKILIVDDSRSMRQLVAHMLRQAGYSGFKSVEAADGAEGLAKALSESPDLVLSDWNMPVKNGMDFLKELRASGSTVTFGFVTTEVSAEMRAQAMNEGAAFLIAKPFGPEDFQRALDAHMA